MNPEIAHKRLRQLAYVVVIVLAGVILCQQAWITRESIRNSLVFDSVSVFTTIVTDCRKSGRSTTEAIDAIRSYYPVGTRLNGAKKQEELVERVRDLAITSLEM